MDQPKVDPKGKTERERASQLDRINTDGRGESIRFGNGAVRLCAARLRRDDCPQL